MHKPSPPPVGRPNLVMEGSAQKEKNEGGKEVQRQNVHLSTSTGGQRDEDTNLTMYTHRARKEDRNRSKDKFKTPTKSKVFLKGGGLSELRRCPRQNDQILSQ